MAITTWHVDSGTYFTLSLSAINSFVNTRKSCDCVKAKGFIIFLYGCAQKPVTIQIKWYFDAWQGKLKWWYCTHKIVKGQFGPSIVEQQIFICRKFLRFSSNIQPLNLNNIFIKFPVATGHQLHRKCENWCQFNSIIPLPPQGIPVLFKSTLMYWKVWFSILHFLNLKLWFYTRIQSYSAWTLFALVTLCNKHHLVEIIIPGHI